MYISISTTSQEYILRSITRNNISLRSICTHARMNDR